jgi:hypothetical protein
VAMACSFGSRGWRWVGVRDSGVDGASAWSALDVFAKQKAQSEFLHHVSFLNHIYNI